MNSTVIKKKLVPIVMIIGGIVFAAFMYSRTNQLIARCTEQTQGVVSDVSTHHDSKKNKTTYKVTVDYNVNGIDYSNRFKSSKMVSRGTELTVKYNPAKPTEIFVDGVSKSANSFILAGGFISVLGVLLIIIGSRPSGHADA